jgi:predicted RecB family nuclease
MKITNHLFEAYLKCPTKSWLLSQGEVSLGNSYADWMRAKGEAYRSEGIRRLLDNFHHNDGGIALIDPLNFKAAQWGLAVNILAQTNTLESRLHAVKKVQLKGRIEDQFVPILFIFTNTISQYDRQRLAFDALILSQILGCEIIRGQIIHGENLITTVVSTSTLVYKLNRNIEGIAALLSDHSPPELVLKRCCAECEFQLNCRQRAMQEDDLSLLGSMTRNERNQYRSRGIFTVNQLSYTFRPRRISKHTKNQSNRHYTALQALAIREKTVFIHGSPNYPESKSQIYLDIEGMPYNDAYYLIGALVVSDGNKTFHSLWADNHSEEPAIFAKLLEIISAVPDYKIFHFGDYEKVALRKMKLRLPEKLHPELDNILDHSVNVLSLVHSHFYFPSYSNSLKDIAKCLGYEWHNPELTALPTIILRSNWNQSKSQEAKIALTTYNEDDCNALKVLCDFISLSKDPDKLTDGTLPKIKLTQEMLKIRPRWQLFTRKSYALEDLEHVNKCAYFDYQREKVFVRTNPLIKTLNKNVQALRQKGSNRPNKVLYIELKRCVRCQSRKIEKVKEMSHDVIDLKFGKGSIRKSITHFVSWKYLCTRCLEQFNSEERAPNPQKCGHGLVSWCAYLNNICGINILRIKKTIRDMFGITIHDQTIRRSQQYITRLYQPLCNEILHSILSERVIHIDETNVKLKPLQNGYVWVLTSMDKVYYFYRPTRETSFLKEMLAQFKGILISDFYTGYDSLLCEQQKCLIHLVRDIDDDILRNPFDIELKEMGQGFGTILRKIISTIDKYGLKRRHLQKHKKEAYQFLTEVSSTNYSSEYAKKYKKRFEKSGQKMFTFLDHDGVPWNNNNAEHAIKVFARHRRYTGAMSTEHTLREYLTLATVFETCEFNNINVLQFLLSKVNTLEGLLRMAEHRIRCRQSAPNC